MRKSAFLLFVLLVLGYSCKQDVPQTEAVIATAPIVGTGIHNGDIGLRVWGPNNRITFSIGKSDVWDRRRFQQEPLLTLADVKERSKRDDATDILTERHYNSYSAYDFPCPKPVGQIILGLPGDAEEWTVQVLDDSIPGVLTLTATREGKQLDLRVYIHAARNLIVFEGNAHQAIDDLWIRLYRHQDVSKVGFAHHGTSSERISKVYDYSKDEGNGPVDPPTAGLNERAGWITQVFPGEPTFPDGFRYTFAALTSFEDVQAKVVEGKRGLGTPAFGPRDPWSPTNYDIPDYPPINEAKGAAVTYSPTRVEGKFQILATVISSTDTNVTLPLAVSRLQEALPESPSERYDQHLEGTKDPGYPFLTRKEGGYYGAIPRASWSWSYKETTEPGHWADFYCAQDATPWHGDFHFDEQQYSRHYFVENKEEILEPYFQLIEKMLPMSQRNAREVYDCPGCHYPLVHYPIKTDSVLHVNIIWEQIMEITALNMKPFWEHYMYTGDVDFLRDRTYNLLREAARFYTAYVTLEEDGFYHVIPTVSPEHWGLTKNFERNKDSQSSLTLIKYHLKSAYQAAVILGMDEEERETWKHTAEKLAPFPTYDTPEGPIFVDVLGAPPITYNILVPLTAIFWGDEITPDSPEEILDITWRTLDTIKPRSNYYTLARCFMGEYTDGSEIGPENLLQSQAGWNMIKKMGGWIRVFPAVPENYSGSFKNYRATGAFEVSAVSDEGNISGVTIYSHAGYTCQLVNPWPGREIIMQEEGKSGKGIRLAGSHIKFKTNAGVTYQIEPIVD